MWLSIGQGSGKGNIGGFADWSYWSSSEIDAGTAWAQFFGDGHTFVGDKNVTFYRVRAIRSF